MTRVSRYSGRLTVALACFGMLISSHLFADSPVTPDQLTELHLYSPDTNPWANASGIAMHPDGDHFYTSGINGIALLNRDAETGELSFAAFAQIANTNLSGMIFSPDGNFVYTRGFDNTTFETLLVTFARAADGRLTLFDTINITTLEVGWEISAFSHELIRSADGNSLYLMARRQDPDGIEPDSTGIVHFELDPVSGLATAEPAYWAEDGYPSISSIATIDLSPDGLHLYAAETSAVDPDQRRLTIFERNPADGTLSVKPVDGITPLGTLFFGIDRGARKLEFANDTTAYLSTQNGINVVGRDPATGLLSQRKDILYTGFGAENVDIRYPAYIAASPDGTRVYAAIANAYDGRYGGRVTEYLRSNDGSTMLLSSAAQFGAPQTEFGGLAVSPDSRYVYARRYGPTPGIVVYERTPDERELSLANELTDGGGPSPFIDRPSSVENVGNRDVYVGGNGDIALYHRDPATRELAFVETLGDNSEVAGVIVRDLRADSAGVFLYAALQSGDIVVYQRNALDGSLSVVPGSTISADFRSGLIVTADRVFVIGRDNAMPATFNDGRLISFTRNPDGTLTASSEIRSGDMLPGGVVPLIKDSNTMALSPDRNQIYTSSLSSSLVVFDISGGGIDLLESHGPSDDYRLPLVTADGKHVYEVSKAATGRIREFARNLDGTLGSPSTAIGREENPEALWSRRHFQGGFGGLVGSSDGLTLHALGFRENGSTPALITYSRDPTNGNLAQRRMHVNGFDGLQHMSITSAVTAPPAIGVSPAGDVVVAGDVADSVSAFRIPPLPPQMFSVTDWFEISAGGLNLSDATNGFEKSPDDKHLYLTGRRSLTVPGDPIATQPLLRFTMDPGSRIAAYVETIREVGNKTDNVSNHSSIMIAPDGSDSYLLVENSGGPPGYLDHFDRNLTSGGLNWQSAISSADSSPQNVGLQRAENAVISPDGKNVYVASIINERSVLVYTRQANGSLQFLQKIINSDMNGSVDPNFLLPKFFRFSPDNRFVYVFDSQRLHTFARNTTTGALTYVESPSEMAGFPGVGIFVDALLSNDGAHLYVGADNGLLLFHRNPQDGSVTYISRSDQGDTSPRNLHLVHNGRRIMALIQVDLDPTPAVFDIVHVVAFYRRDPETGAVTLDVADRLENARNGAPGFNAFASSLKVDQAGHFGWLAGEAFDGTTNIISFALDLDKDRTIDALDSDIDGDTLTNNYEQSVGLDPYSALDAPLDVDDDGLSAVQEALYGTHPFNPDTDGDGVSDGDEVAAGTNPALNPAALSPLWQLLLE